MKEKIYLCGFMGSGKSTVGRLLAQKMNRLFIDTDAMIESESGKTISEIFNQFGEKEFRRLESDVIHRCSQQKEACIIALGGGSLINPRNLYYVRSTGYLVYLKTELPLLADRLKDAQHRPLLQSGEVEFLFKQREQGYLQADWICDCADFNASRVTDSIEEYLMKNFQKN